MVFKWLDEQHENKTKRKYARIKTINEVSGLSGCEIKGFEMAYYSVPCGLITTDFSLTFSSLVTVPNLGGLLNHTTIVKLEVKQKNKTKKNTGSVL